MLGDLAARLRGRAGFDDAHVSVRAFRKLEGKVAEGVELVAAGGLVEGLRAVKDEEELRAMREAARLADGVYEALRDRGMAGRTEAEVAQWLENELRERAEGPSFPVIVAAAENGALPHATPRDVEIPAGTLVVVDMGALLDGYCSDCTRTFATGPLDDRATEVYELVLSAQEAAVEAVRAGAGLRCGGRRGARPDRRRRARRALRARAGPRRRARGARGAAADQVGRGLARGGQPRHRGARRLPARELGVRIEDLVAVTEDGCEILTGFPKALTAVD